jgi:hypothetical protein
MIFGFIGLCFLITSIAVVITNHKNLGNSVATYWALYFFAIGILLTAYQPEFIKLVYTMFVIALVGGVL